jgi:uncharacterized protein YjbJ (UPF0337 family)
METRAVEERTKASERARGRLEEFTGALENRAGEMLGDGEMAARGKARELRGQRRQGLNRSAPVGMRRAFEPHEGGFMNWDQVEGHWKQLKGRVKQKWGKLTDDDVDVIAGRRDELLGKLQERYGIARDQAERQLDEFTAQL